jgi:hypothetical protein
VRTAELLLQKESAERRKQEVERQKEEVELAHRNIALLSEIGRTLTANLDSEAIMATLYEHVRRLMDASVFAVGVSMPERDTIAYPFAMAGGQRCAPAERAMDEPNQVRVEFRDDGRGIPSEHQARIVAPFFTTRMGRGGRGLGLNIAYNIITSLLDGTIRVESGQGQGTTFIVDLPLRVAAPALVP